MESDAYDYGGDSGNVSEEEAAAERRRPKSVIEMPTLALATCCLKLKLLLLNFFQKAPMFIHQHKTRKVYLSESNKKNPWSQVCREWRAQSARWLGSTFHSSPPPAGNRQRHCAPPPTERVESGGCNLRADSVLPSTSAARHPQATASSTAPTADLAAELLQPPLKVTMDWL
ncbi:unnamed protein product [Parnassius apollo]|uniref:(apollo) hypothetical protein n=1 Tax=Parnassius apollo TaxID=110799 RepID=A0A8S3VY65_PARAO|nr:unnamed protein product [Parnassius apollo]